MLKKNIAELVTDEKKYAKVIQEIEEFGEIKQIRNQMNQPGQVFIDDLKIVAIIFFFNRSVEVIDTASNNCQRGPQLVGHIGEEVGFQLIQGLQLPVNIR